MEDHKVKAEEKETAVKTFATTEDAIEALKANPELRDEYLKDPDAFIKKYSANPEEKEGDVDPETDPPDKEEKVEEPPELFEGKIERSKFGNYGKNAKDLSEAVEKLLKGKQENDDTIEFLRNKKVPELTDENTKLKSENLSFKKQLKEYKKQKAAPPPEEFKLEDVQIPELSDDIDFLTDEGRAKFKEFASALPKIKANMDALAKRNTDLEASLKEVGTRVEKTDERTATSEAEALQRKAIDKEFGEIDLVRKKDVYKDVFGESPRPTKQIEDDYIEFATELGKANGIADPMPDGNIAPEVIQLINRYLDEKSEEGAKLRETAKIKAPDDLGDLFTTYEIRKLRFRDVVGPEGKTVRTPVLSFEDATKLYLADPDKQTEVKYKARKAALEAKERALDNRRGHAKETKPGVGSKQEINISQQAAQELIVKAVKKTATPEELTIVNKIIDDLKAAGHERDAAEIEHVIKSD